jgi:hypothetical protein
MTKQALTRAARPLIRFLFPSLAATITCVVAGAALAQDAKLTLSPALVVTGPTDRLAIESDGSFDLSKVTAQQIAISPSNDVRGIKVLDAGPKSVGIALDLSANAQNGKRTVSVTSGGKTASGTLEVIQGAALVIEAPGAASKNKAVTATINVSSRAGVDLSQVKAADVKLTPADFTVIEIVNQASDGLTLGLKVPKAKQNAAATVRIGGDINLASEFSLAGAHAPKTCAKLQHCCDGQASACTLCRPIDQVCKKPGS